MKLILSNYRYFISGGPERYLFSVKDLFEQNGIEVFPFSVKSKRNIPNKWEGYFLSPLTNDDSVYFNEYDNSLKTWFKVVERSFYSPEAFIKARRYAKATGADIVYSLHFLNKMSPSVIDGFKSCGKPVVVRLSDFGLICPQGLLLKDGKNCSDCIEGSLFHSVYNRCVKDSFMGSLLKALAWQFHRMIGSISRIDAFVCPSRFTKKKYIEAGFPAAKMHHVPTFIDTTNIEPNYSYGDYILYFGRITKEKGVQILLKAYESLDNRKPRLILVGATGESEFSQTLKKKYSHRVQFVDFLTKEMLYQYIKNASFVVAPSIWYENMPNVILESFAHGKAVLASRHGSFPEIVMEGKTGLLFEPGDSESLKDKLLWAIGHREEMREMGRNAREYVDAYHSPMRHYKMLMDIFEPLVSQAE